MTTLETPFTYFLEGIIRCRQCGAKLRTRPLEDTDIITYQCTFCPGSQPDQSLTADELVWWLIRQVTDIVLTPSNTAKATREMAADGAWLSDDAPEALRYSERHQDTIRAMATDPAASFTADRLYYAKMFLLKLIDHFELGYQEAVVYYARPLPRDSALAGAHRQHLPLPHDGVQ